MSKPETCGDVCTLPPDELRERLAMIRREIVPHARKTVKRETGITVEFDAESEIEAKLRGLVALEQLCCSTLGWSVERAGGGLQLVIEGVDPESGFFAALATPAERPT